MSILRAGTYACVGFSGVVCVTSSRKRSGAREPLEPGKTGGEGLAPVPEPSRAGEDVRRRGWFWHWNALVTQYAPLIGLKGVGLLNSYTVWTDRREESPHRGYAFPSQQSEADFYGEDRAELITINKILVALDLIEIRKEMVVRADPQGRRWKVPHNFYRVKDHGDDFSLGPTDVLQVAELAARDRAVYRYVRRVFSPRFSPIDGDNVWGRILPEVRLTPVWQELAARATAEEDRASARTRAGHASRKDAATETDPSLESAATPPFFSPVLGDGTAITPTGNDSAGVSSLGEGETSVVGSNTGLRVDVGETNRGSSQKRRSSVAPINEAGQTDVAPSNTTYHQHSTTTKDAIDEFEDKSPVVRFDGDPTIGRMKTTPTRQPGGPRTQPPAGGPDEAGALRAFESANDRAATPAERKLLRDLAARFEPVAATAHQERDDIPGSGWSWLEAAVWDAVEAGSAFVAPRRVREILLRWERDGFPEPRDPGPPLPPPQRGLPVNRVTGDDLTPLPSPASLFTIEEAGLSNRQVWAGTLAELVRRGDVSRADVETWLRPAGLIGRDGATLLVGTPNAVARDRIVSRLLPALREALAATIGLAVAVEVVVEARVDESGSGGVERPSA
jgi:hypothetical protein